ncbi:MAG: orotate phosphoribosyltransferase [Calditrichaeota bacterium]|nr:orotate phosphoribosyltransferase [Calditrichota bacterium]
MTKEEALHIFRETGALLEGHFLLTSGLHSPQYFQCARVLQYPRMAQKLCGEIAIPFVGADIDVVVGPAMGGIVVAQEVARLIDARAIFAEREEGKMTLRRGFEINPGERVLVVEDVVTTGGSIKEVMELIRKLDGDIVGATFLVDRSQGKVKFDVAVTSLLQMDVVTYTPEDCPLCKENIPLVKPGSRKIAKS